MNFEAFTALLGIDESYKAPEALMSILLEGGERRSRFLQDVIALDNDLSHDTLQAYYEDEQALRGNHKQDYTPTSVSRLASMLTADASGTVCDPTAGTGSMVIARWWDDCLRSGSPFAYTPYVTPTAASCCTRASPSRPSAAGSATLTPPPHRRSTCTSSRKWRNAKP